MNEKEQRLAALCSEAGYDGVFLRRRTNIAWLTDGADVHVDGASHIGVASLLWTPREKIVYCSNIESRRLADEEFSSEWDIQEWNWWDEEPVPPGRVACDVPVDILTDLRAPLTGREISRLRALGKDTAHILEKVLKTIRPGATEQELAGTLVGAYRSEGIDVPVVLIAADERIAKYRHPIPTHKRMRTKVMAVVCTRRWGLTVAMTRLVHFGALSPGLRRKHDAVCAVDAALHAATGPGARWCDILAEGQRVYAERGYADEWKRHHQGGPMGYEGRDFFATPTETRRVVDPQAVGWNPSITGTKSEDTILSTGEVVTAMNDWPLTGTRPDILVRRAPRR